MEIREAVKSDLSMICELSMQINRDHHIHLPHIFKLPENLDQDAPYWDRYLCDKSGVVFVAHETEVILGAICGRVFLNNSMPFLVERLRCNIGTVVVAKQNQRSGIGTSLMNAMENWAKTKGAETIDLDVMQFNAGAYELYKNLGYGVLSSKMAKEI